MSETTNKTPAVIANTESFADRTVCHMATIVIELHPVTKGAIKVLIRDSIKNSDLVSSEDVRMPSRPRQNTKFNGTETAAAKRLTKPNEVEYPIVVDFPG